MELELLKILMIPQKMKRYCTGKASQMGMGVVEDDLQILIRKNTVGNHPSNK